MKNELTKNYPEHAVYKSLSKNLVFNMSSLSNSLIISSMDIPQFLHQQQAFVSLSGLVIKFNPMKKLMIFVKLLDVSDLVHSYKVVLCFSKKDDYEHVLTSLSVGSYLWTASKGLYII